MRHVSRGGEYLRVADPGWHDPLDGVFAERAGGRWNPPGSFPVVYLCRELAVARANVYRLLVELPYGPEDLAPDAAPVLVSTDVPAARYVDAVTGRGLSSLGLPRSYPLDAAGTPVPHAVCQPIGLAAWKSGEPGIAARSAARSAARAGEELAFFQRARRLQATVVRRFEDWFWS